MKWNSCFAAMAVFAVSVGVAQASGPISVYGLIDNVTIELHKHQPDRMRIDGVFIVSEGQNGSYGEPRRGYLYLSSDSPDARREWGDLKSVAGTRQVVGFGSSWNATVRVREKLERPESPDMYPLGNGVIRLNADQPRARALLDFKDR